jgi:hypothetical protein
MLGAGEALAIGEPAGEDNGTTPGGSVIFEGEPRAFGCADWAPLKKADEPFSVLLVPIGDEGMPPPLNGEFPPVKLPLSFGEERK